MKKLEPNSLEARLKEAALNFIRQHPEFNFWQEKLYGIYRGGQLFHVLGLPSNHGYERSSLSQKLRNFDFDFNSFTIRFDKETPWGELAFIATLKENCEWDDVVTEAWRHVARPNPHNLTDNALKLLQWARSEKNTQKTIKENTLGKQAVLRGSNSYHHIPDYLREIQRKADPL
jgi:hypothetical protein